jgi:hypothetical protein
MRVRRLHGASARATKKRLYRLCLLLVLALYLYLVFRAKPPRSSSSAASLDSSLPKASPIVPPPTPPPLLVQSPVLRAPPQRASTAPSLAIQTPRRPETILNETAPEPADYLAQVRAEVTKASRLLVKASLQLMARPGHRRRMLDLIGCSRPLASVEEQRQVLAKLPVPFAQPPDQSRQDYDAAPIRTRTLPASPCPVPCRRCSQAAELVVGAIDFPKIRTARAADCDTLDERLTMENYPTRLQFDTFHVRPATPDEVVLGSTRLESDVPLPYFSWHDFGIMEPPLAAKPELAAAFISNCNFPLRNQCLKNLVELTHGRVKSYGNCEHTHDESGPKKSPAAKLQALRQNKFALAFENSETKDYVSEKFWQALVAGSVPVVIGAPNIKFYAPDTTPFPYESRALLNLPDFGYDSAALARRVAELDAREEEYQSYLAWKREGYSDDFKALADLTATHSSCRVCILVADRRRRALGPNAYDLRVLDRRSAGGGAEFVVYVRERGQYAFSVLEFERVPEMHQLVDRVLDAVRPSEKKLWVNNDLRPGADAEPAPPPRVYGLFTLYPRIPVLCSLDVQALPRRGAELEVVFV